MSESGKHTVYVDIDDEITAIIDKVKTAPGKIVALVLPKRATVLQSTVNMKLLKKSAINAKKSLVLITSETGLLPLAGVVGIHVAKSLQSKPEIPPIPNRDDDEADISIEDDDVPEVDKTQSIGALAEAAKVPDDDETETIELDDVNIEDEENSPKKSKNKKLSKVFKVPNFDRFRLSFFLVILFVILLAGGWVMAAIVLPKANIVIDTDTSSTVSDINFSVNTTFKDFNLDKAQVPAVQKEVKKTDTEKATATGKKDNGTKATGTMTLYNCTDNDVSVSAGTTFTSGAYNYTSDTDISVPASDFNSQRVCKKNKTATVNVTAIAGGTNLNISAGHEFSSNFASTLTGTGSAMTGGTSNIVTIVAQSDIDGAVAKMKGRLDASAATDLANALQTDGLIGLSETKTISDPVITATPSVGTETSADITVTSVTTYDILGVKTDFLNQLIKKDTESKVNGTKEGILDNGLGAAVIHVVKSISPTEAQLSLHTIVVSGPNLDPVAIKNEILGKKRGEVENIISSMPGVNNVSVTYSPFWVLSTPKAAKKITVTIKKPVVKPATGTNTSNGYNP